MQRHLVGILFSDSLTFVSLIFGGKSIHQKNPHQKSLILYIYTFQKLNPKYCLFAFEIGYFGHHASIKWKNFLKFLYKKFKIGGLWCCNKVLHNIVYQMPFTNFWYLNPEFCITMSPVCLLYITVQYTSLIDFCLITSQFNNWIFLLTVQLPILHHSGIDTR